MSVKALNYVWEHAQVSGTELLCLLAIADNANDDGEAYPGIARIARKCRVGERAIQKVIRKLESSGDLEVNLYHGLKTTTGHTNKYTLLKYREWVNARTPQGVNGGTPLQATRGERRDTPGVNAGTPLGVNAGTPKPSVVTISKPSEENNASVDLGRVRAAPSGQQPTPAPAKPPAAGVASSKPDIDLRQAQVIVSEEPNPPTAADLADRQKKDFAPGVDVGQAPPGRLVKLGTGKDAYWILREYTVKGLTSHQIRAIRDTAKDLALWRRVCARWAEVYGDDWRKFGHLDWYRNGIPGEVQAGAPLPTASSRWPSKAERSMQAVDDFVAMYKEQQEVT